MPPELPDSGGPLANLSSLARSIAWVGVPSAIALYLVWTSQNAQSAHNEAVDKRLTAIEVAIGKQDINNALAVEQSWMIINIMAQTCMNTARTPQDRIGCLSIKGKQ